MTLAVPTGTPYSRVFASAGLPVLNIRDSIKPSRRSVTFTSRNAALHIDTFATLVTGGGALLLVDPSTCRPSAWRMPTDGWDRHARSGQARPVLKYADTKGLYGPVRTARFDANRGRLRITARGKAVDFQLRGGAQPDEVAAVFLTVDSASNFVLAFGCCVSNDANIAPSRPHFVGGVCNPCIHDVVVHGLVEGLTLTLR